MITQNKWVINSLPRYLYHLLYKLWTAPSLPSGNGPKSSSCLLLGAFVWLGKAEGLPVLGSTLQKEIKTYKTMIGRQKLCKYT